MNLSTRELFTQLQSKLIIKLEANESICLSCKGLKFILVESDNQAYIESCNHCYTGKLYVCKFCASTYKSQCNCHESYEERRNKFNTEQSKKESEAYNKADKISFKDYQGKFLLSGDDYVKNKDDIEEWIYERLIDNKDVPDYLWATKAEQVFNIDLLDIISDKCEDGYEDMYSRLDTNSKLLVQAQELISKWEDEQGEMMHVYNENRKLAVIIKDIVEEIKLDINKLKSCTIEIVLNKEVED